MPTLPAAFTLLILAICATWVTPSPAPPWRLAPWLMLFGGALAAGVMAGLLQWPAVAALAAFTWCAYRAGRAHGSSPLRWLCGLAVVLLALALAAHRLPGFFNPPLIVNALFTPDAAPFTQYANFDKGAVGAILLAVLCQRSASGQEWRRTLKAALCWAPVTIAAVIGLALALGQVGVAPKLPAYAPVFLLVNLFFTCIAEEAFFRGVVQEWLAGALAGRRWGMPFAAALSALLFGLAHVSGGAVMAGLATLAGVGYAAAYAASRRIEAPVLVHFALNAVHFIGFTYPHVR